MAANQNSVRYPSAHCLYFIASPPWSPLKLLVGIVRLHVITETVWALSNLILADTVQYNLN